MNENDFKDVIKSRAIRCIKEAKGLLDTGEYFIGGGCLSDHEFNDIDIYPVGEEKFIIPLSNVEILSETKNATTIKGKFRPLQFCNYKKSSLEDLVKSFDFSHIQVAAHIKDGIVKDIYWSEDFLYSKAANNSHFIGSEYPLSSLVRLLKYYRRGNLTKSSAIKSIVDILSAIVRRGYKTYEDFKDQLDAIDLGLVPEDFTELDKQSLINLFEDLRKED